MMSKAGKIPLVAHQMISMGIIFSKLENKHPAFTSLPSPRKVTSTSPTSPPPPRKQRISDKIIMPPYFITIRWKDTRNGPVKSYTDDVKRVFDFREHQNNASEIKKMLDGIVNNGGSIEYFGVYDPEIKYFIKVSNKEQLDKLLIPSLGTAPPVPGRKQVAETKITRKQLRDLIKKIL